METPILMSLLSIVEAAASLPSAEAPAACVAFAAPEPPHAVMLTAIAAAVTDAAARLNIFFILTTSHKLFFAVGTPCRAALLLFTTFL